MSFATVPGTHRRPAVAGLFYAADAAVLRDDLARLLADARTTAAAAPKALIAPHAGYLYSGPVAASAYARLEGAAVRIRHVVLLGPAHRFAVRGLAAPAAAAFDTPLGAVPVDKEALARIAGMPQVVVDDRAHAGEHSLEVHLPFLQQVLGDFAVLPLVVGEATTAEIAEVLDRLWGDEATLIVVSSDLSHYLPYDDAQQIDRATAGTMLQLEPALTHARACGATPVNGLLAVARRRGLQAELLDLRNSGDTAGARDRVVGYAALAFIEPTSKDRDAPTEAKTDRSLGRRGTLLLAHARASLAHAFGIPHEPPAPAAFLDEPGATFVTLRVDGQLRGCVGSLAPRRTLGEDVRANARAAAFNDSRFAPLAVHEYAATAVEVSVLAPSTPLVAESESDLIGQLRPGIDGVTLECGPHRATLLPQVWEHLADPREFVRALKHKAGLHADEWPSDLRFSRYTVEKFVETESGPA
ncbi:MAG TPA: AmmeMemoRadiSam system protein B [Burkholderiaceae bacterium]|nr:AmmeMemoRadiSam system protein B [Burkholderiaceae bacterium]